MYSMCERALNYQCQYCVLWRLECIVHSFHYVPSRTKLAAAFDKFTEVLTFILEEEMLHLS